MSLVTIFKMNENVFENTIQTTIILIIIALRLSSTITTSGFDKIFDNNLFMSFFENQIFKTLFTGD